MYWHLISFLNVDMTQAIERHPQGNILPIIYIVSAILCCTEKRGLNILKAVIHWVIFFKCNCSLSSNLNGYDSIMKHMLHLLTFDLGRFKPYLEP